MDQTTDIHIELAKIQEEIQSYLGLSGNSLVFNYGIMDGKVKVDLVTINPRHNQSFLFHSTSSYEKLDSLKMMLEYVKSYREKESPLYYSVDNKRRKGITYFLF